jgi:hypothetical protein
MGKIQRSLKNKNKVVIFLLLVGWENRNQTNDGAIGGTKPGPGDYIFALMSAPIQSSGHPALTNHNPFACQKVRSISTMIVINNPETRLFFSIISRQSQWRILSRLMVSMDWVSRWVRWMLQLFTTLWAIQVRYSQ